MTSTNTQHNLEMLHSIYTKAPHKDRQWIKLKSRWIHLLTSKGGMCIKCQESNPFVLEFHHRDPEMKDDQISNLIMGYGCKPWSYVLQEANKCDVVCRSCHNEIHNKPIISSRKQTLLTLHGNESCQECKDTRKQCLDFHHLYGKDYTLGIPNKKKASVGGRKYLSLDDTQQVKDELAKCKVLCKNCHRKAHVDIERWNAYKEVIHMRANLMIDGMIDMETVYKYIFDTHEEAIRSMTLRHISTKTILNRIGVSNKGVIPLLKYVKGKGMRYLLDIVSNDVIDDVIRMKIVSDMISMRSIERKLESEIGKLVDMTESMVSKVYDVLRKRGAIKGIIESALTDDMILSVWNDEKYEHRKDVAKALGISQKYLTMRMTPIRRRNRVRDIPPLVKRQDKVVECYTKVCQLYKEGLSHKEIGLRVGKEPKATSHIISKCMKMGVIARR